MAPMIMLMGRGPYLGALVAIAPERGAVALGTIRDEMRARAVRSDGGWTLMLPSGRLDVSSGGGALERPAGAYVWPLMRFVGTLASKRARYRVELEWTPWSDTRSELGIRPLGHWPPRVRSTEGYYFLAEQTLLTLAREIVEWDRARADLVEAG